MEYFYIKLAVTGIVTACVLLYMNKSQKKKEADADFQADLMMKAAKAKTDAAEQERLKERAAALSESIKKLEANTSEVEPLTGDVYYAPTTGEILIHKSDGIIEIAEGPTFLKLSKETLNNSYKLIKLGEL